MITRKITLAVAILMALALSGCTAVQQRVEDAVKSAPTMTLENIPTSVPNFKDLAGQSLHEQLVKQGFQPNAGNTEYTRQAVTILVQNGVPTKLRLAYPQGTIECPPNVMIYFSYAQLADSLFGLGHEGVLEKHKVCKPV